MLTKQQELLSIAKLQREKDLVNTENRSSPKKTNHPIKTLTLLLNYCRIMNMEYSKNKTLIHLLNHCRNNEYGKTTIS